MSDFLTRMGERALGLAQPVQPLIPSIYAANPAASLDAKPAFYEEISEHEANSAPTTPTERRISRHPSILTPMPQTPETLVPPPPAQTPIARFEPSLFEPTPVQPQPAPVPAQPAPEQPLLVPHSRPRPILQRETPAYSPPLIVPPLTEMLPNIDAPLRPLEGVPNPRISPLSNNDDTRYEASLLPREREPIFADRPEAPPTQDTLDSPRAAASLVPQRPFVPTAAEDDAPSTTIPATTEAPINIRVTINRVEIRSTTPAPVPQAPSQRETGPTFSLDDYLQRRSGGR